MSPPPRLGVLNVGFTRYGAPLSSQQEKKFRILSELADWTVLGFRAGGRRREIEAPVRLHLLPLVPLAGLRFAWMFLASLRLGWRSAPQVLLFEGPYEALAGLLLSRVLKWRRSRVVLVCEVHGDWEASPFLYRRIPLDVLVRPLLRAWASFVLSRMDVLRAVSLSLRDRLARIAPDTPTVVFPTFTDVDYFLEPLPRRDSTRERILYVGALSPLKGIDYLVEAFDALARERHRLELRLAGEGADRRRLEAELERRGLSDRAILTGALSPEEVRGELGAARLLVLPSLSEGLPRVILEAFATGVPVVATETGSIPEIVGDGETGFLVPPRDAVALAEKIRFLLDHPDEAREMGRRGRALVETSFSVARYREGYRELLGEAAKILDRPQVARSSS